MSEDEFVPRVVGYVVRLPDAPSRDPNRIVDYYILDIETNRMYVWPERLHKRRPTKEQVDSARQVSNSQLSKLMAKYDKRDIHEGTRVVCDVVDDRTSVVENVEKYGNDPKQYQYRRGQFVLKSVCIVAPEEPRYCQSLDYSERIEADAELLKQLLPDVPYNAYLAYRLDYRRMLAHPLLHEVDVGDIVAMHRLEDVTRTPWRRMRSVGAPPEFEFADDDDLPMNDIPCDEQEYDDLREAIATECKPPRRLSAFGFMTELGRVFSKHSLTWDVVLPWTPEEYRAVQWHGRLVDFRAYYCDFNKCYVVYSWREQGLPIDCKIVDAEGGQLVTFKAGLLSTGVQGFYWNRHLGFVRDPKQLLQFVEVSILRPTWVYVRMKRTDALHNFEVDAIATECYSELPSPVPTSNCYSGPAIVVGMQGQLCVKDLYFFKCTLPASLRSRLNARPGHPLHIQATFDAETGQYAVTNARVTGRPLKCKRNTDGTIVKLLVKARPLPDNLLYMWTDEFGPIRPNNPVVPSAARFRNCEPLVYVVDAIDSSGEVRFSCDEVDEASFKPLPTRR